MENIIYTAGHSNRTFRQFLALLKQHRITHVADVRTYPISQHYPHFNRANLERYLPKNGIEYLFFGRNLGGRGINVDQEETVSLLSLWAQKGARIALTCSEGDYRSCHRFTMLAQLFIDKGVRVEHLLWDGGSVEHRSEKLF